jgi:hypothetical protein
MRTVTPIKNPDGSFKLFDTDLRPLLIDDGRPSVLISFKVSIPNDPKTYFLFLPMSRYLLDNPHIYNITEQATQIAQRYDFSTAPPFSNRIADTLNALM